MPSPYYYGGVVSPNPMYGYQPVPSYQNPMQRLQNMEAQQIQQMQVQQNQSGGITWVQGAEGAKSYMLPPNTSAILMDSEKSRFYIKTTDASGMPSMRTFEFQEVVSEVPQVSAQSTKDFVSRDEFNSLKSEIEQYKGLLSMLTEPNKEVQNAKSIT